MNSSSHPLRSRISASSTTTTTTVNGSDSLNNSRVVNRFAKKNVNSERERLGGMAPQATAYLENDEEEQDTISDRGKK
jgi:hypothetical protein